MMNNGNIDSDTQNAISQMHPELIIENIRKQIQSGLERTYTVDYLKEYIYQYKYYRDIYADESDVLSSLRDSLDSTLIMVIEEIAAKFDFSIDLYEGINLKKVAKALYSFFVIKYDKRLVDFISTVIREESKNFIDIIKMNKEKAKGKNVSSVTAKMLYGQKGTIMTNVDYIVSDIIPSLQLDNDSFFEKFESNSMAIETVKELFNDDMVIECDSIFESFYRPIFDKHIGYCVIISDVAIELSNIYMINKVQDEFTMIEEGDENE